MLMFRFWGSDHRGSDNRTLHVERPMLSFTKSVQPWISNDASVPSSQPRPSKRRRQSNAAITSQQLACVSPASRGVKRPRTDNETSLGDNVAPPPKKVALAVVTEPASTPIPESTIINIERAKEAIDEQFSLEILLKHNELRLINQELAKCQVALEQLRRCHLIPYPVAVPTPEQMLNIANGTGPSLQAKSGDKLPRWAPPFGVTDGPYARHYAKWLIPDPQFDGIQPEPMHTRSTVEGRSTRNSFADNGKGRLSRGASGQKLQALSSGYPPPKDKSGPCVLKRSDGQTVKLVCIDCQRENFSSTQGFINHCRIAHKRDFKSHEEAAVHCGHPIEAATVPTAKSSVLEEKSTGPGAPPPGLVHPFARANAMADAEACFSVVRRIEESLELYRQGKLPGAASSCVDKSAKVAVESESNPGFSSSPMTPNLSRLLKNRGFVGNLSALIDDAKTTLDFGPLSSPTDDELEDRESSATPIFSAMGRSNASQATPGMRMPARAVMAPVVTMGRASGLKGKTVHHIPYVSPIPTPTQHSTTGSGPDDDEILDATELSPHTAVSINAPSLVSDDGEYDDSADSDCASEIDDNINPRSISDVDEIDIDDDHAGARRLRHHGSAGSGAGTRMRIGKPDNKNVNFVAPITGEEKPKQGRGDGINIESFH